MPFINCLAGGSNFCFPDVCNTPTPAGPVPIPYPNTSLPPTAVPACYTIIMGAGPALNLGSIPPMSNGDNAGVAGGIKSNGFMQKVEPKQFSGKVYAKGKKVTYAFSPSGHNGSNANTVGLQVAPSQTTVWVSA